MSKTVEIVTNGTKRIIPENEPVFLIRGQDVVSGDAVRAWANLAESNGADPVIVESARNHAELMDKWPKRKPLTCDRGNPGRLSVRNTVGD